MGLRDWFINVKTDNIHWEISKGNIPTHLSIYKFGENNSIGAALETIWDGGGNYNYLPDAGSIISLSSNDADDSFIGVGAKTILVYGHDSNLSLQTEIINLDGLSPVYSTKKFRRIWRLEVLDDQDAVGTIYAGTGAVSALGVPATIHGQIIDGNNKTLMCVFTIPKGYRGLLTCYDLNVGEGKTAKVSIMRRKLGSVFSVITTAKLFQNNIAKEIVDPIPLPEGSDIEFRATSGAAGTSISANFCIVIAEKNPKGDIDYARWYDDPNIRSSYE